MSIEQELKDRLNREFKPYVLRVENESHMHSVPMNSETHFKVVMVSEKYEGLRSVKRHQSVYALLPDLLQNPIHALALHLYSPEEWRALEVVPHSPECLGGSNGDNGRKTH